MLSKAKLPKCVLLYIQQTYADAMEVMANVSDGITYVKKNLVRVEIYFNEFNYEYIHEKPKYPVSFCYIHWIFN